MVFAVGHFDGVGPLLAAGERVGQGLIEQDLAHAHVDRAGRGRLVVGVQGAFVHVLAGLGVQAGDPQVGLAVGDLDRVGTVGVVPLRPILPHPLAERLEPAGVALGSAGDPRRQ